MAVDVNITPIGSGFNRTTINDNFVAIDNAFQQVLGRSGVTPNSMNADIDMNSNDILNAGDISAQSVTVDGQQFVPENVIAVGDKGWSPIFAVVTDSARRVLQLTGWTGGEGTPPTSFVGMYVGATGFETLIANGVDIRGDQGASGAGAGDMVSTQNLNDVSSKPTAFANIKQPATDIASGVLEIATNTEADAGVDTGRALVPSNLPTAVPAHSPLGLGDLVDPAADRLLFWDDSANKLEWLTLGTGLTITGTTINAASGSGLGINQSWQTVSRNTGTSYQNTSGVPIAVAIAEINAGGSSISWNLQVSSDGSSWLDVGEGRTENGSDDVNWHTIVPNTHYYRIVRASGSSTLTNVRELKP